MKKRAFPEEIVESLVKRCYDAKEEYDQRKRALQMQKLGNETAECRAKPAINKVSRVLCEGMEKIEVRSEKMLRAKERRLERQTLWRKQRASTLNSKARCR